MTSKREYPPKVGKTGEPNEWHINATSDIAESGGEKPDERRDLETVHLAMVFVGVSNRYEKG